MEIDKRGYTHVFWDGVKTDNELAGNNMMLDGEEFTPNTVYEIIKDSRPYRLKKVFPD